MDLIFEKYNNKYYVLYTLSGVHKCTVKFLSKYNGMEAGDRHLVRD